MQPSTWNSSNQHWIPQFLLKGFGIRRKASKVWELDKRSGSTQERKVKDVASKEKLLTDRDDDLLGEIEHRAVKPIGLIRKEDLRLTIRDRRAIDQLVVAMMINDPYNGFDEERTRRDAIRSASETLKDAIEDWGGTIAPDVLQAFVERHFNHDYLNHTLGSEESIVPTMLGYMGLRAIYADDNEYFIIGDSPVLAVRRGHGTVGPSLLNPGSQVILPISSRCILVYDWLTEPSPISHGERTESKQLLSLNQDYYHESNCRFLYGRTEESLIQSRKLRFSMEDTKPSYTPNVGWLAMQQHLADRQSQTAERNARDAELLNRGTREIVLRAARQLQASGQETELWVPQHYARLLSSQQERPI